MEKKNNSKQIPIPKPNSRPRNMNRKQVSKRSTTRQKPSQPPLLHHQVIETNPLVSQRIFSFLSTLPPGYQFMPNDVELVRDYLRPKIDNKPLPLCLIHPVNLYSFHPRTLAERHLKPPGGEEVYYFTPRDRKYKNGSRPSRGVTGIGYWKATGSDSPIMDGDEIIGYTKTLVFYEGKAPYGAKSNWIMHEYRVCESRERTSNEDMKLDDWVLCKIREKEETATSKSKNKNSEEANVNTNAGDTNTENATGANAVKDEEVTDIEYTRVNEKKCSNSHQSGFTQSHQDMGLPWPQNPSYPFNTCRENVNMISDINGSGIFPDELSWVSGTSYVNTFSEFCEQWESALTWNNDCWAAYVDSCNFPDSISSYFPDSISSLNVKGSFNFQDSTGGLNTNDVDEDKRRKFQKRL